MTNEFQILQSLEQATGKNEKADILNSNKDNQRLFELLDAGLNFFRKFHIHKFDTPKSLNLLSDAHAHVELMKVLNELENRQVTGNSAISRVESFLELCSKEQQKWYSRVINKDLKIGVSVKTAAKYFDIPTFDVMLATDGKKCKKLGQIIEGGVYASPKLDGYRCLAVIAGGSVTLYSRNGSVYTNFPIIEEQLLSMVSEDVNLILDGEIMSDDFQSMQQSAFASTRGTTVGDVTFHIFDFIPYSEWQSGKFKMKKSDRLTLLNKMDKVIKGRNNIVLVDQERVDSIDRVLQLEQKYMAMGYEGVMVVPDIPYYKGRKSNKLMKFKTMLSQDCEIVGFYEGTAGTRNEGRLGGLVLKQENGLTCECGSGFSDEDRDYIWNNQSQFLGRTAEIKYQELTNHNIMRFPIFMRWRDDK
jgi:DNA ligase-1